MRKSLHKKFLDKAHSAIVAAIEIYNKPTFMYREEAFAILSINAWELLLKAKLLKDSNNSQKSINVYENRSTKSGVKTKRMFLSLNRAGNPKTISLFSCISKIETTPSKLDREIIDNIYALVEVRDNATHCINANPILIRQVFEISCACIKNFILLAKKWFNKDFSESISLVIPLAFIDGSKEVDSIVVSPDESKLIEYLQHIAAPSKTSESPFSIAIRLDIKYEKSCLTSATKVVSSKDPDAFKVSISEEDIRKQYPWDYKELVSRLQKRYCDFKANLNFHKVRKPLMHLEQLVKPRYLDPGNPKSPKKDFYSPNIVSRFDSHYTKR